MPYYQSLGYKKGSMPVAEAYYSKCLSLPMYPTLTNEEQDFVIQQVILFLAK
jgi:dTDP-4-amino-4,6-dideoxygalactose transaminase